MNVRVGLVFELGMEAVVNGLVFVHAFYLGWWFVVRVNCCGTVVQPPALYTLCVILWEILICFVLAVVAGTCCGRNQPCSSASSLALITIPEPL